MPTRIFKVDLSDGARDYAPTATEPGLAMLDKQMANYGILRRWLGDFAAEPEFLGDQVSFFIREEERGRLENIECYPATKSDLEGALKPDLEALSARVKKIKPDSRTEELLAKIVKTTFNQLTNNLETSDHDSFFFQYRERGQPWKLVWCWGYQRADMQPAPALICSNPQCTQLYVRRPNGDDECPGCTTKGGRRKGGLPWGLTWERIAMGGLALLLLLALFLFLNQPKLIVEPGEWHGPVGSIANFKVTQSKYFFFNEDVTLKARGVSDDPRVLTIKNGKGTAKSIGETHVAFSYNGLNADIVVGVDPPSPPDSIRLEPEKLELGIGSVGRVKLIGHYDEGNRDVELSPDQGEWVVDDEAIAFGSAGFFEGAGEGKTKVLVKVLKSVLPEEFAEATLEIDVANVKYETLVLDVSPDVIPLRDTALVTARCADKEGKPYDFMGSTRLNLNIEPSSVASLSADVLTGVAPGKGDVKGKIDANLGGLESSASFQVGDVPVLAEFTVSPKTLTIMEDEYFFLTVTGGGGETIMSETSDDRIVQVTGGTALVGRSPGKATVTVKQGDKTAEVQVEVLPGAYTSLAIEPRFIRLKVDETASFRVTGTTREGKVVDVDPSRLVWVRQPPAGNVYVDREKLVLAGQKPMPESPLIVKLGALEADGAVEVVGERAVAVLGPSGVDIEGDFEAHPPIRVPGVGVYSGGYLRDNDLMLNRNELRIGDYASGGVFDRLRIPRGARIVRIGDRDLSTMSASDIRDLIARDGIREGSLIEYEMNGNRARVRLGEQVGIVQEVKVVDVRPLNLSAEDFNAEVLMDLLQDGDYRIVNDKGEPLSSFKSIPAGPGNIATDTKIKREESLDHNYKLFVERKRGETVRKYEFQFKLKPEGTDLPPVGPAPIPSGPARAPAAGPGAQSDVDALKKAGVVP